MHQMDPNMLPSRDQADRDTMKTFRCLQRWRNEMADERNVPRYQISSDGNLKSFALVGDPTVAAWSLLCHQHTRTACFLGFQLHRAGAWPLMYAYSADALWTQCMFWDAGTTSQIYPSYFTALSR